MTKSKVFITLFFLLPFPVYAQEMSMTLDECLEYSRTNNPEIVKACLDTRIARVQKQEAASMWFPNVSAMAGGFHSLDPFLSISVNDVLKGSDGANNLRYLVNEFCSQNGISNRFEAIDHGCGAFVNVMQPVFAGGRIANGNALASLGVEAAELQKILTERNSEDTVTEKFWTVVSLSEKKKALRQGLELILSLDKDVSCAVEAGVAKESDLMQVKLKRNELEALMRKLKSGERLAKMDLFNTIGYECRFSDLDLVNLDAGMEGMESPDKLARDMEEKVASTEEKQLLDMSVRAKELQKKMAVGEALPEVAIGAFYGYMHAEYTQAFNGGVFAMVKIPISDWGKNARRIQKAEFEKEKAIADRDFLSKQLYLKASKDWMDLESAWDDMASSEEAVRLSELIENQKREEYNAGLCTMSELLQCQTDLQTAKSNHVDRMVAYCIAVARWD